QEEERQDADQHEGATGDGVDDELHRRVLAADAAPDPDQQEHRGQLKLPEEEEDEQVQRDEDARDGRLEELYQHEVELRAQLELPGDQDDQEAEEAVQEDQRQADAVDADPQAGADL